MRQPLQSPAAWKGAELFDRPDWLHELDPAEIDEVRDALARVDAAGLELEEIDPETFPLPTLSRRRSSTFICSRRRRWEKGFLT